MSPESKPAGNNIDNVNRPFVQRILIRNEINKENNEKEFNYQMGYLYAAGILEKIYEWADFQKDSKILISDKESGRFVINVRWNFREVNGKKVCDEVGVAYLGEIYNTPMLRYEAEYPEEGAGYSEYYGDYKETADFFLVWGQNLNIVRYFPQGKVEEAIQALAKMGEEFSGYGIPSRAWVRLITQESYCSDAVDVEKTEQDIKHTRLKSAQHFENNLIDAINKPRIRQNPSTFINSPFKTDFGENTMELFDKFEEKIRRIELKDRIEERRRMFRREPTVQEKVSVAFSTNRFYSYEDMILMEDDWDEYEQEDYSSQDYIDHSECSRDEDDGLYYAFEEYEGHSHVD